MLAMVAAAAARRGVAAGLAASRHAATVAWKAPVQRVAPIPSLARTAGRSMSTGTSAAFPVETVIVYELATTDPWTNLAAEEWCDPDGKPRNCRIALTDHAFYCFVWARLRIFGSTDWRKTRALLLYRNEPAVVIGRHQNPWLEVNIRRAMEDSVPILRRRSGGGTVYHVRDRVPTAIHGARLDTRGYSCPEGH